jgi:hypothetical protein
MGMRLPVAPLPPRGARDHGPKCNTSENLCGLARFSVGNLGQRHTGTYLRQWMEALWSAAQVPDAETLTRDLKLSAPMKLTCWRPGRAINRASQNGDAEKPDPAIHERRSKRFYDCMSFWDRTHGIALGD